MKDKLRELAEMVRDAYRAGFIAACKWPSPVSQDVDSSAYNKEFNAWSFSVREKHAAILNAEGGGVAGFGEADGVALRSVKVGETLTESQWSGICQFVRHQDSIIRGLREALRNSVPDIDAHPERSGVVRDEECREFLCKMPLSAAHTPIEMVRAAIEYYERTRK